MKVSIVSATYNSEKSIEACLRSVREQDYPNIEHIVIDGASNDKTLQILEANKAGIGKLISEKDDGIYDALNKGIEAATGDVIGFLHSDDLFAHKSVISHYVELFKNGFAAVYSDLNYVSQDLGRTIRKWRSGEYKEGMFKRGWMPPHPTFYVRKEVYAKFGKFNTDLRISADYECMLRLIHKEKINVAYLPELSILMRVGGESNKSLDNRLLANKEDVLAWEMNGLKRPTLTRYLKPLRKIGQFLP